MNIIRRFRNLIHYRSRRLKSASQPSKSAVQGFRYSSMAPAVVGAAKTKCPRLCSIPSFPPISPEFLQVRRSQDAPLLPSSHRKSLCLEITLSPIAPSECEIEDMILSPKDRSQDVDGASFLSTLSGSTVISTDTSLYTRSWPLADPLIRIPTTSQLSTSTSTSSSRTRILPNSLPNPLASHPTHPQRHASQRSFAPPPRPANFPATGPAVPAVRADSFGLMEPWEQKEGVYGDTSRRGSRLWHAAGVREPRRAGKLVKRNRTW
ncbi:hypothetical protein EJ05DRAFT_201090 [Pseudovirgaria hyperparasitica]|uniref:Uncharacterized protein n=1 Tax=Pseudovirgaria hyperparasitica TaxID=470096 RepID=A0A6A6WK34_9PEZI|nr:uncharacterized protein EJ05DRAFT_201090 [Pseudovirgaria hyperparasitica]KAF2762221.1 hypothetical protein EJ05DRAFT_201090 [Pseudovirgaria hyperparasitica]